MAGRLAGKVAIVSGGATGCGGAASRLFAAEGAAENDAIDQANTLFWKWNRRRLDFESMRDRVLAASGAIARRGSRTRLHRNP